MVVVALALAACASPRLAGKVTGTTYTSARGDYSVPFPAPIEAGGRVVGDDFNGVTFRSNMAGDVVSYYSYPFEKEKAVLNLLKEKGKEAALVTFAKEIYNSDNAHYHPTIRGGAISLAFIKAVSGRPCGAAAFMENNHIYVVESEPPVAAVFLGELDKKPKKEYDEYLEKRVLELLSKIILSPT
jgi:hypothetical protein